MSVVFWAWVIVAVVCALSESVSGGGYTLPWSFGAGTAAGLEAAHISMRWQWVAFFVLSSIIAVVYQRVRHPRD